MIRGFFLALILVALGYALSFFLFVSLLPRTPDTVPQADGIVALTGGGERLDAAEALLEKGSGQRLLISGVSLSTTKATLKERLHGDRRFDCCADIGYAAENTHGNAVEAADWARAHNFKSLVIVTARYHMPRALNEFTDAMPGERLTPYPVDEDSIDLSGWWRHPQTTMLLHREYLKYLTQPGDADRFGMIRSALFLLWFACVSALLSLVFVPVLILPRGACVWLARNWARASLWGLRVFAGIDMRVTGTVPHNAGKGGGVLLASKHMSMWDTLALYLVLDDPAIVLKRELLYIPFYGWFLWKATAIAIDRGAGASALRKMTNAAKAVIAEGRPILIFPEGTRKKPGALPDYKPGVAAIYSQLGVPCIPVALDSGRYWTGFFKQPGTITLAFLEAIPPGLKRAPFMAALEDRIETATNGLLS